MPLKLMFAVLLVLIEMKKEIMTNLDIESLKRDIKKKGFGVVFQPMSYVIDAE